MRYHVRMNRIFRNIITITVLLSIHILIVDVSEANEIKLPSEIKTIGDFLSYFENGTDSVRGGIVYGVGEAGDAFGWANTSREYDGYPMSYCAPQDKPMSDQLYMNLFLNFIADNQQFLNKPANIRNFVLFLALKQAFPCE